ncbi:GMP synthase-like glutamine amidotransferase [Corynebacterium afermentans]
MRITVLQPDSFAPMQRLGPWLERAGATLRTVDLGEPLPIDASGDPLILLGGRADALDTHASPWLPAVHELLRSAFESGTPVLGICLGHQIIADCFGGEVSVGRAAQDEEGATQVTLTDAGVDDPLLGPLGATLMVEQSHHDAVVTLPPRATLLASSERCPIQAMRLGSIVSVQFHPECSPEVAGQWAANGGHDGAAVEAELLRHDDHLTLTGKILAEGFVAAARAWR